MIVTALISAVLYGTGAAVEQRQAAAAPDRAAGRPRLLATLARQPLWLLGMAAQVAGFGAHAVALRFGPLTIVQMLVASELIVAIVVVRIWSRRPLSRGSWAAALTVVAGIVTFLALASPSGHGDDLAEPAAGAVAALGITRLGAMGLAATAAGAAAAAFALAGLRAAGRRRAVLLAVAAGLADACSAVVTMAFSHAASHGPAAVAGSWPAYALVGAGLGNVLLTQTAYQTGRPMITLPIISAVTPAASVAVGMGILGETPRMGLAGGVAAALTALVTSAALAWLARSAPARAPGRRQARPAGAGSLEGPPVASEKVALACGQGARSAGLGP